MFLDDCKESYDSRLLYSCSYVQCCQRNILSFLLFVRLGQVFELVNILEIRV
jgi:hypothetical protein